MVELSPIIFFVEHFEECLSFYKNVFDLKLVRNWRGPEASPWTEFQVGNIRLTLHGGYKGVRHKQGKPVAIHFEVEDIQQAVKRVEKFGGSVKRPQRKVDYRPEELMVAYTATFADPDENEFEILQVLERFDS